MRQGYKFEREIELWGCRALGQDPRVDFSQRSYRTATSGAKGDGDVRIRSPRMPFLLLVECKHRKYHFKGDYAFRLDREVLQEVAREASSSREPQQEFAVAAVAFAFKGARRDRVWFAIPFFQFGRLWMCAGTPDLSPELTPVQLPHKSTPKSDYLIVRRSDLASGGCVVNFPGAGPLVFVPQRALQARLAAFRDSAADAKDENGSSKGTAEP